MFRILLIYLLLTAPWCHAQLKGKITDSKGEPLPYVNIYIEDSFIGTTSNDIGEYELQIKELPKNKIVFQCLGYTSKSIKIPKLPYDLQVVLEEKFQPLNEVIINYNDNPTHSIIKNAIASRKTNTLKTNRFEADFYSKGIFKVKNIRKKILGKDIGDFKGSLDSSRSGVIYLSETVSKIKFEKPNKFKENIVASKVAGNNRGFSFNTAQESNYDLYENIVNKDFVIVSPIASNAFEYYQYKLENTFQEGNFTINKIAVKPKRNNNAAFEGHIYIVEDSWAIYGADLHIKGIQIQQPFLEQLKITQNFIFNANNQLWVKNLQSIEFTTGIFKMNFTGKFTHIFNNYIFKERFEKNEFNKEIVSFVRDANTKQNDYWSANRAIPLTNEEIKIYHKKDSIQYRRESIEYLDSLDQKNNKFKIHKLITGYSLKNTYKNFNWKYDGLIKSGVFNTVQGWVFKTGFSHNKWNEQTGKNTSYTVNINYGLAEQKLRYTIGYFHQFNQINYSNITLTAGNAAKQFNPEETVSELGNSVSSLFLKTIS